MHSILTRHCSVPNAATLRRLLAEHASSKNALRIKLSGVSLAWLPDPSSRSTHCWQWQPGAAFSTALPEMGERTEVIMLSSIAAIFDSSQRRWSVMLESFMQTLLARPARSRYSVLFFPAISTPCSSAVHLILSWYSMLMSPH